MPEEMTFAAPYDRLAVLLTAGVTVGVLALAAVMLVWVKGIGGAIAAAISLIGLAIVALFQPLGYRVDDSGVGIRRLVGPLTVPKDAIASVEIVREGGLGRLRRQCASGGLFGYFGVFGEGDRDVLIYTRSRNTLVRIDRRGARPLVVGPDDPDRFRSAVRRLISG